MLDSGEQRVLPWRSAAPINEHRELSTGILDGDAAQAKHAMHHYLLPQLAALKYQRTFESQEKEYVG